MELIYTFMAELYGCMENDEESERISDELIGWRLKQRRTSQIHKNLYNQACHYIKKGGDEEGYKVWIENCIYFSQLGNAPYYENIYKMIYNEFE